MAKTQFIQARALSAVAGCGVACNDILEGPPATMSALAAAGFVDIDPSAVAYAQSQNARVVTLADSDGAAELAQSAALEVASTVAP